MGFPAGSGEGGTRQRILPGVSGDGANTAASGSVLEAATPRGNQREPSLTGRSRTPQKVVTFQAKQRRNHAVTCHRKPGLGSRSGGGAPRRGPGAGKAAGG